MSTPTKPYVRPQAPTKDQLRAILAQAVRNTQPELNPITDQAPGIATHPGIRWKETRTIVTGPVL